jgi:exodeoxyribonuclease-5
MELTNKQEQGLKAVLTKYKNHCKYAVVSGYAGAGKSTLVRFIVEALDVDEDKVAYGCYTGKAAEVLRKKGNKNAMTLHKLLYDSIPKAGGGFFRKPKVSLEYNIVIVDEVSMVPKSMVDLLLSYRVFVIFLGDPFQLSQLDRNDAHQLLDTPDIFLDEVMRQAKESEIIRLTMKIRNMEKFNSTDQEEVMIIPKEDLSTGHMKWADIILCATNNTRHMMNTQMREILGYSGDIQTGERIIIKRNYWEECNLDGDALVNGSIGTIENPFESFVQLPRTIKNDRRNLPLYCCNFIPDGGSPFNNLDIDKDFLLTGQPCVDWRVSYQLGRMKPSMSDILPKQATYGYALTVHSAQGS